jgi:uncharacterized phiE125 gp8 family phage protein
MPLTLVTPPDEEPVTLAEAKAFARIDVGDEDQVLMDLLKAAREMVEQATGRAFIDQTWRLTLRDWPCGGFVRLPKSPLLEVISVVYRNTDGDYVTLQQDVDYHVDHASEPGAIDPGNGRWPTTGCYPDGVVITFRAGYVDMVNSPSGDVPDRAKLAIKSLTGFWYDNREPVNIGNITTTLPLHVSRMIQSLRVWGDA